MFSHKAQRLPRSANPALDPAAGVCHVASIFVDRSYWPIDRHQGQPEDSIIRDLFPKQIASASSIRVIDAGGIQVKRGIP
jgi:hypothetical protein